ncbi:exported hypothetical protein [Serratia proteamaculans]|uniref:hypothetical protein n=1 Tax=Serratia proteamaculans TaxID=28151 RepID=UPI0009F7A195|nr:hypothetical protein [Serratia proteamaculans]SMB29447.1 exported hypothetical protein [Serratia proteamaculans]
MKRRDLIFGGFIAAAASASVYPKLKMNDSNPPLDVEGLSESCREKKFSNAKQCPSVAELRNVVPGIENQLIDVVSYYGEGGGNGGGIFQAHQDAITKDNGGTVIRVNEYWVWARKIQCKRYSVEDFGARGDGETDDSEAIVASFTYPKVFQGSFVIECLSERYKINSSLGVIDFAYLTIEGNSTLFDFSMLKCGSVALEIDYTERAYSRVDPIIIKNIGMIGPGKNSNASCLMINPSVGGQKIISNVKITNFGKCVVFGDHAYLISFRDVTLSGGICIYVNEGVKDSGENIRFYGGVLYNSIQLMDLRGANFSINMFGVSLDYSGSNNNQKPQVFVGNSQVNLIGCHIEFGNDNCINKAPFAIIDGDAGTLNILAGEIIVNLNDAQSFDYFCYIINNGRVIIDNTFVFGLKPLRAIANKNIHFNPIFNTNNSAVFGKIDEFGPYLLDADFSQKEVLDRWFVIGSANEKNSCLLSDDSSIVKTVYNEKNSLAVDASNRSVNEISVGLLMKSNGSHFTPRLEIDLYRPDKYKELLMVDISFKTVALQAFKLNGAPIYKDVRGFLNYERVIIAPGKESKIVFFNMHNNMSSLRRIEYFLLEIKASSLSEASFIVSNIDFQQAG